jgi:hypothetical protein
LVRRAVVALVLGAFAAPPAVAQAGSYDVYSCKFGSSFYGNNAWVAVNNAGGGDPSYSAPDVVCATPGDPLIAILRAANFGKGVSSELLFTPPADTRITDYTLGLRHRYSVVGSANPAGGTYRNNSTFTMAVFGAYAFSLTGEYDPGVATYVSAAPSHYWGAGGPVDQTVTLSKADGPPAMLSNQPTATALALYAGCWGGAPDICGMAAGSISQLELSGSRVTIEDNRPPDLSAVQAGRGLLAPGTRAGDEPVTLSAADNSGIRRAELVDVTDTANPTVVALEDYNTGPNNDAGLRCDYTRPRPCPDLKDEAIRAPTPIAGHRTLIVRVTDAGGETAVSAPFSIYARGPLNGTNGGDGARIVAGFPAKVFRGKGKKRHAVFVLRPSHTVAYGKGATIRGTLKGADGQPVSGGDVRILVRENRLGAQYVDRGSVTTGPDGRFVFPVPAGSSRLLRLAYRAYLGDDAYATRSTSTLNTRARISVRGPRHVGRHGLAKFSGRLVGRPFPPRGITVDLQIFQPGVGWRVFANARTRKSGTFTVRYHFQRASQGRFTFRIRLRPNDAYPYSRGVSRRVRVRVG